MNEWEAFFDGHAPRYMDEPFVTATQAEVDFIEELLHPAPEARVLDVGCGTGRHAVELARRGYAVTGVDISRGMLTQAAAAARAAGVTVDLVHADARAFRPARPFDLALCLCEGSFGLLGAGDDPLGQPLAVCRTLLEALRPGGRFIVTVLNGLRFALVDGQEGAEGPFDPMEMCQRTSMTWRDERGEQTVQVRERGFVPTEMRLLCSVAGLAVDHVWGGTAGDWGQRPLVPDEYEIMVVGHRPE